MYEVITQSLSALVDFTDEELVFVYAAAKAGKPKKVCLLLKRRPGLQKHGYRI
jgi:hypothetical protein